MAPAAIRLRAVGGTAAPRQGTIAGVHLLSDWPLPLLRACPTHPAPNTRHTPLAAPGGAEGMTVGELLDAPHPVHWRCGEHANDYRFADGSVARIAHSGTCIDVLQAGALVQPVLCGPVLLTALAALGRHCLHASAFTLPGHSGAWLAVARSGIGKSTLARTAARIGGVACCDDLSVIGPDPSGVLRLWPRYWQLKWAAHQHWPAHAAAALPIRGVLLLDRAAATWHEPCAPVQAVSRLVQSSVATRLWQGPALATHLQAITRLVEQLGQRVLCLDVRDAPEDPHAAMLEACHTLDTLP